ncbi:MAG: MBL fold metallo-hydrolase [Vicinamibacterales bacterium]
MTRLRTRAGLAAGALLTGVLGAVVGLAQQGIDFDRVTVRSFKVQDNVFMLVGAGSNVTVQIGDDGVLVVDTQFAPMADKLLAEIARLSGGKPIRYVINTHVHGDHTGGNARFREAGNAIVAGNVAFEIGGNAGALILAHENVQHRMVALQPGEAAPPAGSLPTDTFFDASDEVYFNGEAVELLHQPAAHTDGDILVHFRRSDVVSTGDIYNNTGYPFIDIARGGTINGIVDGLNRIVQITVPRDKQEGGTMVIPGHGRIADEADVVEYRDMITIIRDRVQDMVDKGLSLDAVKAARPTSDYDGRYGSTSGFWTTDMFVEAVYRTLGGRP